MTYELATLLLAEFDERFTGNETNRAGDIALHAGGVEVRGETREGVQLLWARFDSGYDAARAAIDMVAALDDGDDSSAAARRWGMRVVVCTMREWHGSTTAGEWPPELAAHTAQLLSRAGRGSILTTATTAILIGATLPRGVDLRYSGAWTTGPQRRAERLYELCLAEVNGHGDATSNLDWARRAAEAAGSPGPHLRGLLQAWRHSTSGHLRMTLLTEAGGTTRTALSAEVALRVHTEGALVLHGRWEERGGDSFHALREALGSYAGGCTAERLRADLDGHVEDIVGLLPELAGRMGVSPVDADLGRPETGRTAEALGTWLQRITARRPTLLVLDDLQWADSASVRLLTHLWHTCGRSPLTVVLTAIDDGDDGGPVVQHLIGFSAEATVGAVESLRL